MAADPRRGTSPTAATSREANETLNSLAHRAGKGYFAFICECSDPSCFEAVPFSGEEYDRIVEDGHFLVAPGHHHATHDELVGGSARFAVVARTNRP